MKFYSETLKKFYDSAEDCEKAEVAYQKELEAKRAAERPPPLLCATLRVGGFVYGSVTAFI